MWQPLQVVTKGSCDWGSPCRDLYSVEEVEGAAGGEGHRWVERVDDCVGVHGVDDRVGVHGVDDCVGVDDRVGVHGVDDRVGVRRVDDCVGVVRVDNPIGVIGVDRGCEAPTSGGSLPVGRAAQGNEAQRQQDDQ